MCFRVSGQRRPSKWTTPTEQVDNADRTPVDNFFRKVDNADRKVDNADRASGQRRPNTPSSPLIPRGLEIVNARAFLNIVK